MPEPIFSEDPFEPEEPKEETMDDVISEAPEHMRPILKMFKTMIPPKFSLAGSMTPTRWPEPPPIEYEVAHYQIGLLQTNNDIKEMLNRGWRIEIIKHHQYTLFIVFARIKEEKKCLIQNQ